jgi:predicted PurR-regulated permease PerM
VRNFLTGILALIALLYIGKPLLVPLSYALLLAIVLHPMVKRLERSGMPRPLSIAAGLVAVAGLFTVLMVLLLWQFNAFVQHVPELRDRSAGSLAAVMEWLQRTTGDIPRHGEGRWEALLAGLPEGIAGVFAWTVDTVFGMVLNLVIIPVLTALILHDRRRYVQAITLAAGPELRSNLPDIVQRSVHSFSRFIGGMAKVYVIVGTLNSVGLWLLGIENAILFGMLSALMTIVPYVGITISALLPMSVAYITYGDAWHPLGVVAVFSVVQYLEANLIFPRVVGHQLKLNTFASIVIVLVGALLWGVSGMILLLPFMAIVRIISSDIPALRPLDLLLGNGPLEDGDGSGTAR